MRVQVIYGEHAEEMTDLVNSWLKTNESRYVIISISPAMPREKDGGYITITYTTSEKVFGQVENSRD